MSMPTTSWQMQLVLKLALESTPRSKGQPRAHLPRALPGGAREEKAGRVNVSVILCSTPMGHVPSDRWLSCPRLRCVL